MGFETILALLLCLIGIIAGAAPAKYPQYAGVATFIFWMAVVALVVLIIVMVSVSGVKRLAGLIGPSHGCSNPKGRRSSRDTTKFRAPNLASTQLRTKKRSRLFSTRFRTR